MNKSRKSIKSRILVGLMLVMVFISTTASSCDSDNNGVGDSADLLRKVECDLSKMADGGGLAICK